MINPDFETLLKEARDQEREKVLNDIITLIYMHPERVPHRQIVDEINGYRMISRTHQERVQEGNGV